MCNYTLKHSSAFNSCMQRSSSTSLEYLQFKVYYITVSKIQANLPYDINYDTAWQMKEVVVNID